MSGYQFDMDSSNQYTGQLYEGQGRNIITSPGTIGMLLPGNCKILLGTITADPKAAVKPHQGLDGEWQQIEIIARGNTLTHIINGQVMSITDRRRPGGAGAAGNPVAAARGQRPDLVSQRVSEGDREAARIPALTSVGRRAFRVNPRRPFSPASGA